MYIVVAEVKKLAVIDYFIVFFCNFFSILDLLKEFSNWCGWIPMCIHTIKIICEARGGDGSVLSVYANKKSKRSTLTKLGDAMFDSGRLFFWTLVSYHGD